MSDLATPEPVARPVASRGSTKDTDINTGPWELVFQDSSTSKATLDRYNTLPQDLSG